MAAILYAREKGVEVHISTQLSVSNTATLRYYARFADVVVLARELSLEQVAEIHRAIEREQIRGPQVKRHLDWAVGEAPAGAANRIFGLN